MKDRYAVVDNNHEYDAFFTRLSLAFAHIERWREQDPGWAGCMRVYNVEDRDYPYRVNERGLPVDHKGNVLTA